MPRNDLARFDPRFVEAWIKATKETLEFRFTQRKDATRFRHQLYTVRRAMEQAKHPAHESAKRAEATMEEQPDGTYIVRLQSTSETFNQAFKEAGIEVEGEPDIDLPITPDEDSD